MEQQTIRALSALTDEGVFEKIATAVLRLDKSDYAGLAHPGMNADGKTRKSPVDGIMVAADHILIAHHTIAAASSLRRKWLLAPETVKPRSLDKPGHYEPGDLIKALGIIQKERAREPGLDATVVLTTNQEPGEDVIRDTVAVGRAQNVSVDIWTRSRIAHVLDLNPTGQVVRRKLLQIEEDLLSRELLQELGAKSVAEFQVGDDIEARVERALDNELPNVVRPLTFVVGASGTGKSVACHKAALQHVANQGAALVLSHEAIETSQSLEQALLLTLVAAKPSLHRDQSPLGFLKAEDPLLVVVEDVSRSNQPQRLIEKLVSWIPASSDKDAALPRWRLLCPIWPQLLSGVSSQTGDRAKEWTFVVERMSPTEAEAAIARHAARTHVELNPDQIHGAAEALAFDPLLIALNNDWTHPNPDRVLERFAEDVLGRIQANQHSLASDLRAALRALGAALLARRKRNPGWEEIATWGLSVETLACLRAILQNAELLAISGASSDARIRFRHDRIRDWILVDAAVALEVRGELTDAIVGEPLISEIIAGVLVRHSDPKRLIERVQHLGPLALFHGIRRAAPNSPVRVLLVDAAEHWLSDPAHHGRGFGQMRWEALLAIEDVEADFMVRLVKAFPGPHSAPAMLARVRNGDLRGGIELCGRYELHTALSWLQRPIATAMARRGAELTDELAALIDLEPLDDGDWTSAIIRFVGLWQAPALGPRLSALWRRDSKRDERLGDYLFACARCAELKTVDDLLTPVCTAWGQLPEVRENNSPSPRDDLASHSIRWAFEREPPLHALDWLIRRAEQPDLRWPIEYLLHGVDHPTALALQVERMAARRARSLDYYFVSNQARQHWSRARDGSGTPMSIASRAWLLNHWRRTEFDEHQRVAAFDLWTATHAPGDLAILRAEENDVVLAERVLRARIERGDVSAIPTFIQKLDGERSTYWWYFARHLWSPDLFAALDRALSRAAVRTGDANERYEIGHTLTSVILRLSTASAEELLVKYWPAFGADEHFVQAALYVGTPKLLSLAAQTVAATDEPKSLFRFLTQTYGIKHTGEVGVTREQQMLVLEPYLGLIEGHGLSILAEECNRFGWFATRQRLFDSRNIGGQTGSAAAIRAAFDRMLEGLHAVYADFDVDRMLEAGASFADIAVVLRDWLPQQNSPRALDAASRALMHAGQREDLDLLALWPGDPSLRDAISQDTRFAVCRQRP